MKVLKVDLPLFSGILLLVGLGIVIIYSSSGPYAEMKRLPQSFFLVSHIQKVLIGFVALIIGLAIDYRVWAKLARPMLYGSLVLLLFLVASGMVGTVNGARRWVFGIQPSELAKISLIFFLARIISERSELMKHFRLGFVQCSVMAFITFALILKQPNFSTAATVFCITTALLFAGGARVSHMLSTGVIALPVLFGLMLASPYRVKRVMAFVDPSANPASAYQSVQSLISLGNGGFFGTGLGTSTQKLGYLPMPFTDTIFAILGEELGLIGTFACLLIFAMVVWRGLRISYYAPEKFGSLVALGITVSLAVNVLMHVGVCAKFFPTTGQPLPFVSYGGTNLCVALFAVGVLLNISSHSQDQNPFFRKITQRIQILGKRRDASPKFGGAI